VLTTQDAGRGGRGLPDEDVLHFADDNTRTVLTMNRRHFVPLHSHQSNHYGIIVCTVDPDAEALARRIDEAVAAEPDLRRCLIRVNRPSL
jgi:hypothetical protein